MINFTLHVFLSQFLKRLVAGSQHLQTQGAATVHVWGGPSACYPPGCWRGHPCLPTQLSGPLQGFFCPQEGCPFLVCTEMLLVPSTLRPRVVSAWRGAFPKSRRLYVGPELPCMPVFLPTWLPRAGTMYTFLEIPNCSFRALDTELNKYLWKGEEKEGKERRREKEKWRDR